MSRMALLRESRSKSMTIGNPANPAYWVEKLFLGGSPSATGLSVTPQSSLSWTAISAGVRISAETIASLPWGVFESLPDRKTPDRRTLPGGSRPRTDHPVHFLLHNEPNEEMTAMEFIETAQAHALWWGGSASQIVRNGAGQIAELWPLNPDRCRWERDADGSLWLRVTIPHNEGGGAMGYTRLEANDVFWVRGFSTGGIMGASLPAWHREAIGLGLATDIFISAFFGRGANAGGILTHPKTLSKEAQGRLRESVNNQVGGLDNAQRLLILEEGMTWTQTSVDPQKAELLGLRKFQLGEAARILRIPPHLLGDLDKATFSNIEHQAIEFVQHHVRPWVVRWEQRCNKQLFGRKEKSKLYVKANVDALLRGDLKSRMESLALGIQNRIYTPNEARGLLDLNPGPDDLDEFQVTPNMNAPSAANGDQGGTDGNDSGTADQAAAA